MTPDGPCWPDHATMWAASRADPDRFWLGEAKRLRWHRAPTVGSRRRTDGHADWFPDGELNICAEALDRHVRDGHGDRAALIWDGAGGGTIVRLDYRTLLDRVARFAGGLRRLGVGVGDRVLISMPPVPEAVIAMLATARLGAVHCVVFAGFAGAELARRIDAVRPRAIVWADRGFAGRRMVPAAPAIGAALAACRHPPAVRVLLRRAGGPVLPHGGREHDFGEVERSEPVAAVPVAATHPLYVLHTSGTTGTPKGVVRDHGGHAVALALSMPLVYGVRAGDVFFTPSDPGWVVGHSYGVYGPLLAGCTSVLFEDGPLRDGADGGGRPGADALWRVCGAHRVAVLLAAPAAFRAMRGQDPDGVLARRHDLSALQAVFVAGERSDPALLRWTAAASGTAVHDHWWQTETGWSIAGVCRGFGATGGPGEAGRLEQVSPGFELAVLDVAGRALPAGKAGEVVLRLPLPPGCLSTLWNDADGFRTRYLDRFPGCYRTFDVGARIGRGGLRLLSRSDDVLKIAGRRIAGGSIEDAVSLHPAVGECAVVGVPDALRGETAVAFVVVGAGEMPEADALLGALNALVRERVGGFLRLRAAWVEQALPRTRSGKILRRELAAEARRRLGNGGSGAGTATAIRRRKDATAAGPVRNGSRSGGDAEEHGGRTGFP